MQRLHKDQPSLVPSNSAVSSSSPVSRQSFWNLIPLSPPEPGSGLDLLDFG